MSARSKATSSRPKLSFAVGASLLACVGATVGYVSPYASVQWGSTVYANLLGTVSPASQLAVLTLACLIGAVIYYGIFILAVKLFQAYGFLRGVKDLHRQSNFLVYGYVLLATSDIALSQTPGSMYTMPGYSMMMAALYGLLYVAVATMHKQKMA